MPKCKDCGHSDAEHNDAGCFADYGAPCFCRASGESIRFPEEYGQTGHSQNEVGQARTITIKDALAWHYSIPSDVLMSIVQERERQNQKWGEQNHDAYTWLAILSEEVGEAAQAALHNQFGGRAKGTLRTELVQVAAVVVQWLECIDRNGGEK